MGQSEEREVDPVEDPEHLPLYIIKEQSSFPIQVSLNNQPLLMEVDTGAAIFLI